MRKRLIPSPDDLRQRQIAADDADRQARSAESLLGDPMLKAAFAAVERRYMDAWRNSTPTDHVGREAAYFQLKALTEVQAHLDNTVSNARLTIRNAGLTETRL